MSRTIKKILRIAFVAYIIIMIWLLFGQRIEVKPLGIYFKNFLLNINLFPFYTICNFIKSMSTNSNTDIIKHSVVNLGGNVIMFIPLGFFLPCIFTKLHTFGRCMLCASICIIIIELVQLFTLLGICDVDDFILNMLGSLIGYRLYQVISRIWRQPYIK